MTNTLDGSDEPQWVPPTASTPLSQPASPTPTAPPSPATPSVPAAPSPASVPLAQRAATFYQSSSPAPPSDFWAVRWPGPDGAAPRAALLASCVAGLLAAIFLHTRQAGLGWLLTAVGIALAAAFVRRAVPSWPQAAWGAATLALFGVGTVRATGWLFALCVPLAVMTGALALAGGRSTLGMLSGLAAALAAPVRALPWAGRGLRSRSTRSAARPHAPLRALTVAALSALLLGVFGALLTSADAAFAKVLDVMTPSADLPTVLRKVFTFFVVGSIAAGVAFLVAARPRLDDVNGRAARSVGRYEWAIPVALLDLLFALFVAVQFAVLFAGRDHVVRTAGLTFAQYARSGFWQLLTVTVLTLLVIGVAARVAPTRTAADRLLLRLLLGGLAALTLVIVASAIKRMSLYEQVYGYTQLRVFVLATELWLGLLFVLVLAAGVRLRGSWLPTAFMASAVIGLLALAMLNPDRFVADRNVDRYQQTGRLDVSYLSRLSADAAPATLRLPPNQRPCSLARFMSAGGGGDWNYGRWHAARLLTADDLDYCR